MGCEASTQRKLIAVPETRIEKTQIEAKAHIYLQPNKESTTEPTMATQAKRCTSGSSGVGDSNCQAISFSDSVRPKHQEGQVCQRLTTYGAMNVPDEEETGLNESELGSFFSRETKLAQKVCTDMRIKLKDYPIKNSEYNFMKFSRDSFDSKYTYITKLGAGGAGEVFIAKQNSNSRAVKVSIKKDERANRLLANEIKMVAMLDHPNIVKAMELISEKDKTYAVFECLKGGTLEDHYTKSIYRNPQNIASTIKQLLYAVNYLHSQGIVHRDIKHRNIIFEDEPGGKLKLIDFGTAIKLKKNHKLASCCGTIFYIAPEVLTRCYDFKCDIWSIGVILYTLIFGNYPFNGNSQEQIKHEIYSKNLYYGTAKQNFPQATDLLQQMLKRDPTERITAAKALEHPFFKEEFADQTLEMSQYEELVKNCQSRKSILNNLFSGMALRHGKLQAVEAEAIDIFEILDTKKKGYITFQDLAEPYQGMHKFGPIVEKKIGSAFKNLNLSMSGQISYSEVCLKLVDLKSEKVQNQILSILDPEWTGSIPKQVIREQLYGFFRGDFSMLDLLIKQYQLDSGEIMSYQEVRNLLKKI